MDAVLEGSNGVLALVVIVCNKVAIMLFNLC
jgi:hypothetical protein